MCNTQLTTGLEGRWGFSCLGSFPLFVKRLTLIVSPRCECRRDMRWNTATGKLTQPAQKKNRKKTTISNPTPKLKNKTNHHKVSASYTWTWIAATSPTTAGPLKLCSGFKISDFFLNIKLGNLESYSTWKPDTLLRAVEDLKRQQQLQAVVQQDFGRTESYQVGGNKFIFLISPCPFLSDQESLATSLLSKLDGKTTSEAELTEAFCRDVDSFSFEFERQVGSFRWWFSLMLKLLMMILVNLTLKIQESPPRAVVSSRPQSPRISSNKPPLCAEVFNTFWKIQTCWKFWYYKPPLCAEV